MAGAYTAVADDASAAFWNPAGLAPGSYFSAVVDRATLGGGQSALLVAIGTPPLGMTYYRTATALPGNGRNTLVAHHAGLTLVQSIGDRGLSVGATLKLVRGAVSIAGARGAATSAFDADVGLMAAGSLGQAGISVRNLLQPAFAADGGSVRLDRRVRAGVAVHAGHETTVAGDAELTAVTSRAGRWRDAAVGVEHRARRSAWIRAGVDWNTAGGAPGAAPTASVGLSYAIRRSLTADAQASGGSPAGRRGWGVGLRLLF
jgi:hypothetical protein